MFFFIEVKARYTCGTAQRVSRISKTAVELVRIEELSYLLAYDNAAERSVSAGNALCEGYHIRLDTPVFASEVFACSAPACHYLLADHHDTELVTYLAYTL